MNTQVRKGPAGVNPTGRYPRPPLAERAAEAFAAYLRTSVELGTASAATVRLACAVALTRCAGARHGELAATRVGDIDEVGVYRRRLRPQGRRAPGPLVAAHRLSQEDLWLLGRWMTVREELVDGLDGGEVTHLLVTVHHTHSHGQVVKAGMPIRRNGLEISYRAHARRYNARFAGAPWWEPLPTRYEQLRRAWNEGRGVGGRG